MQDRIKGQFEKEYSFEEASKEWLRNKKRVGYCYKYICDHYINEKNRNCQRTTISGEKYCSQHSKIYACILNYTL